MGVFFCYRIMEKKYLPFNFKFLGNIDITEVVDKLSTFTEDDWLRDVSRNLRGRAHQNTHSIGVLWDGDSLANNSIAEKNEYNYNKIDFDSIKNTLLSIYKKHYGDGHILRVLLARLKPNSIILEHEDAGKSLLICNRTHIPLQTNDDIIFSVGHEEKILKPGEIWEINNAKLHSVKNNSNEYRIHLIVDYLKKNLGNNSSLLN